jgi:hypothetical protein
MLTGNEWRTSSEGGYFPIMATVQRKLTDLSLWPDNYNEGDIGLIIVSILTFGFDVVPRIWVDPATPQNQIVMANNHACAAVQQIHMFGRDILERYDLPAQQWPPANVTEKKGDWLIDVLPISHLSYDEAAAFAVADNEIARKSVRNLPKLIGILSPLAQKKPHLFRGTGIDRDQLDDMLKLINPPSLDDLEKRFGEPQEDDAFPILRLKLHPETMERYLGLMEQIGTGTDAEKFRRLIDSVDLAALEFED